MPYMFQIIQRRPLQMALDPSRQSDRHGPEIVIGMARK